MQPYRACLLLCLLSFCLAAGTSWAQLEGYALTHPFALPGSTTTRLQAMGGMVTCLPDRGFPNPAYAGLVTEWQTTGRYSVTEFDGGLALRVAQVSAAGPLRAGRSGFQVTGLRLDSDTGPALSAPGSPPFSVGEWTVGLHYGQRVSDRLTLGLGVSPCFHNRAQALGPAPGVDALRTRASGSRGFRVGATYLLCPRTRFGAVYDNYDESVTATGLMLGGATIATDTSSKAMMAGVSHQITDRLLAAAEWFEMTTDINGRSYGGHGWRAGLEAMLDEGVSLRVGDNDGSLSAGVGIESGRVSVRYAYLRDWNEDLVGAIWGGSTTNQFEATYHW
jgi:hypothetical protein